MDEIPGLPARRAALRMLDAVLRRGETLDQAEHNALKGVNLPSDRALGRAIAAEALRWMPSLDDLIDGATRLRLADDAKPRMVLRLMLAQWLRLETPPHAAIATGLPLLTGGPRRLAHGVFSTLVRGEVSLPDAPDLPEAVALRWGDRFAGVEKGLKVPPPLDIILRDPADTALWAERLGGQSLATGHVRLPRGAAIETLEGFEDGAWWVQDLAASLPARLLGQGNGRSVLDLCAAPGGKSLQLAANGWKVTALDTNAKRMERVRQNLDRVKLDAELLTADAFKWEPDAQFDAILIDAPCTATGTARRHPDVLHRISDRQIGEMAHVQRRMIEKALPWLKPEGVLVYAVCSLEQAEGEDVARQVKAKARPILAEELPEGLAPTAEGYVRTDPSMLAEHGGLDGFFVARWER